MTTNWITRMTAGVVMAAAFTLAGGCSSDVTPQSVRSNMTPEMQTITRTPQQMENQIARSLDTTLRQIWDDLMMIGLVDQPSRLHQFPIP